MQNHVKDDVVHDPDAGWKPNNRPQSTVARNFSAALDDLFRIDGGLDSLSKNVFDKKLEVTTQSQELQALEARLRATEERLKKAGTDPSPTSRKNSQRRTPVKGAFDAADAGPNGAPSSPLGQGQAAAAQAVSNGHPD